MEVGSTLSGMHLPETLPPLPDAVSIVLPFQEVTMSGYAWWQPRPAPAVLLYHGWGQHAGEMAPVARLFQQAGWHAVSLSMRGWAGSTGTDDYGRSNVGDTVEVLNWLERQPNVESLHLLGFSMGGMVMLLTALLGQTPAQSVTAVSAPTDFRRLYETTAFGGVRRYYDAVLTPEQWLGGSPLTHASQLSIPALVVVGLTDRFCPPEQGQVFAEKSGAALLQLAEMQHEPSAADWETIVRAVVKLKTSIQQD